ncbi:peptidoglycan/LPS O-acetylase OafA/YrhL [Oxalobacteraceae bacterium GrIS 1.11]
MSAPASTQGNNFNLIRLLAAWLVLFSHSYHLTGFGAAEPLYHLTAEKLTFGTLAVGVFFSISGYLITASAYARASFVEFLIARMRRIFPALIAVVLLSALLLGPAMSSLGAADYFANHAALTYIIRNITMFRLQYTLPGVFETNPLSAAVNGSLWTLPVEFSLYLAVGGGVLVLRRLGLLKRSVLPLCALAATCLWCWYAVLHGSKSGTLLLVPYFMLGAICRICRDRLLLNGWVGIALWIALALSMLVEWNVFPIVAGIAISYNTLWIARHPRWVLPFNTERIGDLSYGIYLFAFPVQQTIIALHPAATPMLLCALATLLVVPLAWLTWHGIEQRFVASRAPAPASVLVHP